MNNNIKARLDQMKAYRQEALADPIGNKLYIEDLDLSIAMFSKAVNNSSVVVQRGFIDATE